MVIEAVLNLLFMIVYSTFAIFPDVDWSIPDNVFNTVEGIVSTCCYFLPMDTVVAILAIVVWFNIFRIGVSFIKTLWQIIPLL